MGLCLFIISLKIFMSFCKFGNRVLIYLFIGVSWVLDLCCEMPRRTSPTSANSRTSPSVSTKGVVLISDDDVHSPISLERISSSKITAMAEVIPF